MNSCSKCASNQNTSPLDVSDSPDYNLLPRLYINSVTTNIYHLTTSDIDLNMPCDVNFDYYDSHEFHSSRDIVDSFLSCDSFSAIHCNVRSLSANYDSLTNMLSELYFHFH